MRRDMEKKWEDKTRVIKNMGRRDARQKKWRHETQDGKKWRDKT